MKELGDPNVEIIVCTYDEELLGEKKYGSLFYDLKAGIDESVTLTPNGGRTLIPTGIKVAMPLECFMDVRPRSGLAHKFGVTIANAPGTVDSDFRGQVCAIMINHGQEGMTIHPKDRICQVRFVSADKYRIKTIVDKEVFDNFDKLYPTDRGAAGFGSSGM